MILLDTHVALWIMRGDAALGKKARAAAEGALQKGELAISSISFWEVALLISKGRLRSIDDPREQRNLMIRAGVRELPLSGEIAILAAELETLHHDPADRFIAATAIAHSAILMTADERILKWKHSVKRQDAES